MFLKRLLNKRWRTVLLVGVPLVNLPQGERWAAGGEPRPSPPP